jgi:hypothetical protein
MATGGASTPPTLDGLDFTGVAAESWEVVESELVGNVRLANGAVREQRLAPPPGSPAIRRWYQVTLDYRHLATLSDQVEARLSFPGPHQLSLWKHVTLGYVGDGALAEWSLPWRLAPHLLTPPAGAPIERFAPLARLGFDGPALVAVELDTASYEAGTPESGECWFDKGGPRFKLAEALAAGSRLVVHVVPLFQMVIAGEDHSRQYRDPIREPRRIALIETEL